MNSFTLSTEYARRENVWARIMLMGPAGAGKTLAALTIATNLLGGDLPITGADTERQRMKLYADQFAFFHEPIVGNYTPETFVSVIEAVEAARPGGVLIIDSFSHEWMGTNGVLQLVDKKFGNWKEVRPRHSALVDRIMAAEMHVICCVRSKMKYEVGEEEYVDRGGQTKTRQQITKLGIGPVQDDAIIYEFDIVADIDARTHEATFSNRCAPLVDTTRLIDADVAAIISRWLSEGDPPEAPETATDEAVAELRASLVKEGFAEEVIDERFAAARVQNRGRLHPDYVAEKLAESTKRLADKKPAAAEPAAPPDPEDGDDASIPDGDPSEQWRVVQVDAYAAREQVENYPSSGTKREKLDAIERHHEAIEQFIADSAAAAADEPELVQETLA